MNKESWISMFHEIGLDEEAMVKWHRLFENKFPEDHQSFLEWLNVPEREIVKIRSI